MLRRPTSMDSPPGLWLTTAIRPSVVDHLGMSWSLPCALQMDDGSMIRLPTCWTIRDEPPLRVSEAAQRLSFNDIYFGPSKICLQNPKLKAWRASAHLPGPPTLPRPPRSASGPSWSLTGRAVLAVSGTQPYYLQRGHNGPWKRQSGQHAAHAERKSGELTSDRTERLVNGRLVGDQRPPRSTPAQLTKRPGPRLWSEFAFSRSSDLTKRKQAENCFCA